MALSALSQRPISLKAQVDSSPIKPNKSFTVDLRLQNETGDALSSAILTSNLHQAQVSENRVGLEGSTGNENVDVTVGEDSAGSQTEQDDHISLISEQSQDLAEPERERVRQIFREWMSTGGNGLTSNGSSINSSPRAQLLGRTELERIRVVREWIHTACDQRESVVSNREEHVTEIGSQIERVREGLVVAQGEGPTENNRRDIRRLCGRQALVDLLANNERERRRELQVLLERCPVSSFGFRNRIQSVLRIRLLRNRSVEYNRTNSTAESELGFLRQRNTVSGLREGFLSRMEYSVHDQANDHSSGSSNTNTNVLRRTDTQPNSSVEVVGNEHEQVNPVIGERSSNQLNHIEDPHCGNAIITQGDADLIEATLVHDADEGNRQEAVADEVSVASDYGDEELQLHSSLSYAETVHSQHEEIHDAIFEQHDHSEYYGPHCVSPEVDSSKDQFLFVGSSRFLLRQTKSAAFTGVHGYAVAAAWVACGLGFGLFLIAKNANVYTTVWNISAQRTQIHRIISYSC